MPARESRGERRALSHLDRGGRPRMVDVGLKEPTARRAVAEAEVRVSQETLSLVIDGGVAKGDVLTVAELAGIMAAKRTAELIPLCHPVPLTEVAVEIRPDREASAFRIRTSAAAVAPTGVEMEALVAAAIAGLTVYDMVKSADRGAELRGVRLLEKSGGKSGTWRRAVEAEAAPARAPRDARGAARAIGRPAARPRRRA